MQDIFKAWCIQIEVTNDCSHRCAHCTHGIPHFAKPYFMDLETLEKALASLRGWGKCVGCMGGEPTLHPQFDDICRLFRKYFPRKQRGLFTSGGIKYREYEGLIRETFGLINYNDHARIGKHQPVFVASSDVIKDEAFRNRLINQCWLQRMWSPAITRKGCFFCEVAATIDALFNGPGGYPMEKKWWKKREKEFQDQRERYCRLCSVAVPMEKVPSDSPVDYVSVTTARLLRDAGSPLSAAGRLHVVDKVFSRNDIKKLIRSPSYNRNPFRHTRKDDHNWHTNLAWKYDAIFLRNRIWLALKNILDRIKL